MTERAIRVGATAALFAFGVFFFLLTAIALDAVALTLVVGKVTFSAGALWAVAAARWTLLAGLGVASLIVLRRSKHVAAGTRGLTRLRIAATLALVLVGSSFVLSVPVLSYSMIGIALAYLAPAQFMLHVPPGMPDWWMWLAIATLILNGIAFLGLIVAEIGFWFLVPVQIRKRIWYAIDVVVFAAFAICLQLFRLDPRPGFPAELRGAVIRLLVTVVFTVRVLYYVTPLILDAVESFDFRSMVAARMLRAGKSGFLTAIGILSILAVTVASAAPSIVLSVMGGFRSDLKRKILGNNAHVVIDRERGSFEGWGPLLARTRAVPGVVGAAPYVSGEVMISSSSNLSGAVLRGIDPDLIGEVTDLPRNITTGRMDYLRDPERLLHLSAEEMNAAPLPLVSPLPRRRTHDDTPIADVADAGPINARGSVIRDIDQLMRGDQAPSSPTPQPLRDDPRDDGLDQFLIPERERDHVEERDVLPGIIVGQELARTLRLFLGDEVNVVSPFGGLGPAGPIPKSRAFRVAGIFYSGMYEYDMKYAYMLLPTAQEFLSTGDAIHGIEVKCDDMEHAPEVRDRIKNALHRSDLQVRDWQELNQNLFGALALEKLAMFLALGIAILVAGFCVFGTLTLMVQEKSKQVGVLKAMGTAPESIVRIFLSEGLLIGVFGATMGLGVGYVVCFAFEHFGVAMNPEVYYIDRLPIHVDPVEFLLVALSSVVVCLLATIFPAILASRVSPIQALRQD